MSIHNDQAYWTSLTWPAAPNLGDYSVFESYCTGRVLLLGSTKLLLPLCTEAWDLEPKYADDKIKNKDWFTLDEHWDTITINGDVNLVDNVRVNNTEAQRIPVYIVGNVIAVNQNTSPWVISANSSVNSDANPIYVNFTNDTISLASGSATIGNVNLNTGNNVIGNVRLEAGNNIKLSK